MHVMWCPLSSDKKYKIFFLVNMRWSMLGFVHRIRVLLLLPYVLLDLLDIQLKLIRQSA
jgi:hypothetical protein